MIYRYCIYFTVFCVANLNAAILNDVSYSVKQNGVMVNIDYDVDPKIIVKEIKIPIQGGLDPKILLTDKEILKKEVEKYLQIFKDHPSVSYTHLTLPTKRIV